MVVSEEQNEQCKSNIMFGKRDAVNRKFLLQSQKDCWGYFKPYFYNDFPYSLINNTVQIFGNNNQIFTSFEVLF